MHSPKELSQYLLTVITYTARALTSVLWQRKAYTVKARITSEYTHRVPPENGFFALHLSRSLKVIGNGTDRSDTYDFLLVIHSDYLLPFPR